MTSRQHLIKKVAITIARSTDYHLKPIRSDLEINVIEITTDENEEYVMNTTDSQWQCYSNSVLKLAEQLHWDRYYRMFD